MVEEQLESVISTFEDAEIINKVVMPNHIHFILFNGKNNSVIEIIRKFKAITAQKYRKEISEIEWEKIGKHLWQASYFDVIIRNTRMFDMINRYIEDNPKRWKKDRMNDLNDGETDNILNDLKEWR